MHFLAVAAAALFEDDGQPFSFSLCLGEVFLQVAECL
jgi:hypothetical protein